MRNVKIKPKDNYPRDKFGNKMTGAKGASRYDNTNYKEDPEWKVNRIKQEDFNYMPASELKRIKKESYNKMYGGSLTNDSIIQDRHSENYLRASETYWKKYGQAPTLPTKSAKDIRITNSKNVLPISVNKNTQRIEYKQNPNKPQQSTEKFGNSALTKGRVEAAKFSGLSKSSQRKQGVETRKTSITDTFDGVPVQGEKTVSNNGRRIKAVWDFPNGGKMVEKEKLNNAGQTVSYRSVSKKINPKKVPKQEIDYNSKLDQKKGKYKYEHIAYFDNKAYFGKGVHNPRNKKAKVTYDFPNGGKRVVVERFNDANDVVSRRIKDVKQNPKRVKKQ